MPASLIIGGALKLGSAIFGSSAAKKRARALARQLKAETKKLNELENSRQQIVNPYSNVQSVANLYAKDLSSKVTNPFANLGVATKAAEIQMEQSDIALANTLDTLRATGASAGGATALAMAALKSKQGIAADIEKQEMTNQKLRADGEQKMNEMKRQEAIRLQSAEMDAAKFQYTEAKDEELRQLDRQQGLLEREWQQQAALESGVASGIGGMMSAFGSLAGMGGGK